MVVPGIGFLLAASVAEQAGGCRFGRWDNMDGLRGEYGFLTEFNISESAAREHVRVMSASFGICEFQFYDAFEDYSWPPVAEQWRAVVSGRPVLSAVLRAYIDEIGAVGGRAWLYVQAMASSPGDLALEADAAIAGAEIVGKKLVNGKPLLDVIRPSAGWAKLVAPRWASFARRLGFAGIHWDSLEGVAVAERSPAPSSGLEGFPSFLRAARPLLAAEGLGQSANFVDGADWQPSLWTDKIIAFPYWEVWTVPEAEDRFFAETSPTGGGVFVCYPGLTADHEDESQNRNTVGVWPIDLLIARWRKARSRGNAYLVLGDGLRYLQDEYFPGAAGICPADVEKIQSSVFDGPLQPQLLLN